MIGVAAVSLQSGHRSPSIFGRRHRLSDYRTTWIDSFHSIQLLSAPEQHESRFASPARLLCSCNIYVGVGRHEPPLRHLQMR
jgi:hypothetical protein